MTATVSLDRRLTAEFLGTLMLLAAVVGSGIMAETLAGGNVAIALLGNTLATSAILAVLIWILAPVSGAHFNPAVTLSFALRREITPGDSVVYVLVQIAGAVAGVWLAHAMFDVSIWQESDKTRSGAAQWLSEAVATFGLVLIILGSLRWGPRSVGAAVGLYIAAAYWFTASTSFANPAVTIGRTLTDTFSGIYLADMPAFIAAQISGAVVATALATWLMPQAPSGVVRSGARTDRGQ